MRLSLLLLSLLFNLVLFSQTSIDSLAPVPVEEERDILGEIEDLMTNGKPKNISKAYKNFEAVFASGVFLPEEQEKIKNTAILMRSKRLGASPHFLHYLNSLVQLKTKNPSAEMFAEWHGVLEKMLTDENHYRANAIAGFLKFSADFYEFSAIKYSPASVSWYAFADDYKWSYDGKPIFKMDNARIVAIRHDDTLSIDQTKFYYDLLEHKLQGTGGKTDWSKTSLGSVVYVTLEQYSVETIRSLYTAPVAYLVYPQYFGSQKIKGSFSDKLVADQSRTSYPRFESENSYINIPNVNEGVRLKGGFRLHGSTVFAYGSKDRPAEILVLNKQKQPRFQGDGNLLMIKDQQKIVGEGVNSILLLGADSLSHPSVNVRLNLSDLSLELSRGKTGKDRNPFFHSLHQMNIDADFIKAYLLQDSLVIGRPKVSFANKKDVVFESLHYFNQREYNRIQSIATANPIAIMKATAEREGSRFMPADLLASRIDNKFTVENIKPLLYDLLSKGFINYDEETGMVEIKEKIFHYVNAANKNTDYDFLRIESKTSGVNATINLKSGYTFLEGIEKLEFSKLQKTAAIPKGHSAILKGNRDFDFGGKLFAGFATFESNYFEFEYENFQINLDSIKYFDLYVPTGDLDENNQPKAFSIGSRIEKLEGVLLIDAPNNKSGVKDIFIFPSLQSKENSYVYYDSKEIEGGAYERDSFYFKLDPFTFDHLDKYGPQDIHFKGNMVTNGIFPEIRETLVLREDNSLGFVNESPEEGYATFLGKGTFKGLLDLSNEGLQGIGTLEYLQATIDADDFMFTPDKATASAEAFDLEEDKTGKVPVPQVHGEQVNIEWRPYSDSLMVTSEASDFQLYKDNDHRFDGLLVLTPRGLQGDGDLDWSLAKAHSEVFTFGAHRADADTMNINIKALDGDDRLALETNNVAGQLDFDEQNGHFEANDQYVITKLPFNEYITSMNKFDWDMTGQFVTFEAEKGQDAFFTSIKEGQDSLKFTGKEAAYDLTSSLLEIEGVNHIVSADAFIYPDSQHVEIAPHAEMATLENAKIVADTVTEYHVINRATVNIKGKKFYTAKGFYEYNVGPHEQEFELQNIVGEIIGKGKLSEKRVETRATGEIEPSDTFFIDNKTLFRGTISLKGQSKSLHFDGFARINAELLPQKTWFTVPFQGDKNDLVINYDVPNSYETSEPLFTGIFLSKEYGYVYPRALAPLNFRKDRQLLPLSKGVFRYLEDKDQFVFGDSSVVIQNELVGNKMIFKNRNGSVEAEGKFNLGSGLKYVSVDAAGRMNTAFPPPAPEVEEIDEKEEETMILLVDPEEEETEEVPEEAPVTAASIPVTAELMMGIKMLIPEQLLRIVHNDFVSASFEARAIAYRSDVNFYNKVVREMFPATKEREIALQNMSIGALDIPKKANPYTFLFSHIDMKWHQDYLSFVSTKKNNGLNSINGETLNKNIECYVELKMPSTKDDDRLYIYLKSPSGLFYFFGFKQGILSITSNNTVFMQQLEGIKAKDLVTKMPDGETFEIQAVEVSSANLFLRRITAVQ